MPTIHQISRKQAAESLRRILVFFKPDAAEAREYVDAVWEQIRDACRPTQFDQACQIVVRSMEPYKRPLVSEYLKAIAALSDQRTKQRTCNLCGGLGLVYDTIENRHNPGETSKGMRPCDCRKLPEVTTFPGPPSDGHVVRKDPKAPPLPQGPDLTKPPKIRPLGRGGYPDEKSRAAGAD